MFVLFGMPSACLVLTSYYQVLSSYNRVFSSQYPVLGWWLLGAHVVPIGVQLAYAVSMLQHREFARYCRAHRLYYWVLVCVWECHDVLLSCQFVRMGIYSVVLGAHVVSFAIQFIMLGAQPVLPVTMLVLLAFHSECPDRQCV